MDVVSIIGIAVGVVINILGVILILRAQKKSLLCSQKEKEVKALGEQFRRDFENERREAQLKLKDELYRKKMEFDSEIRRERGVLEKTQLKLDSRLDQLGQKEQQLENKQLELQSKERTLIQKEDFTRQKEEDLKHGQEQLTYKLESIAKLSRDEARTLLCDTLREEVTRSQDRWMQKVEEDARTNAKEKVSQLLINIMQRQAADVVSSHSSNVVHLPNDDMKGRIIGKEGRNIKALEMATGMEFVIGDTPEIITISGFNPVRREIARRSLEKLIVDGRINPTRIEETVAQCEREVDDMIEEYGKNAVLQLNLQGVKQELVTALGKLHFRTSFSQNVLAHSIEVGLFARMLAEELGIPNPQLALRAGLFHDIGKAVSGEQEGPHALVGADIAKHCGENPLVVSAIAAHHEEVPFTSIYGPIVLIADIISAARPGARRETLSTYIKRLEKLEELAYSFKGIKKAYAVQAGREIRVIVEEDLLADTDALMLARELAKKIEAEVAFPGQIKVNIIREKRAIEYAR
ncbi:MAG: Ribonuclease Y [candidate division TM6 bacterium GW2011_GWE2_41_16]|nr:MAG: Ribonuclease Y [candidate division TM6 bacterium GW2011_GWE2_41_16]